tara:strand:+ start:439 stop:789 length:351 start_codon:yes stop_codon:yes gene_type:complete
MRYGEQKVTDAYTNITITDNLNVIKMWKEGKNARNQQHTLVAIGGELISNHRKIGHRTKAGVCVVADLDLADIPTNHAYNIRATKAHITLAKRHADTVFHQLVSECSPLFREEVPF